MKNIILVSLFVFVLACGFAESKDKKEDWSKVKKLKQETWLQVKTIDGVKIEGQFGDVAGEKLLLITGTTVRRIPKEEIREISKQKGKLVKSILIGAGVGYASGLLTGLAVESRYDGQDKGLFTFLSAMTGGIIGATGTAIDGIDRWRLVYKAREK